MSTEYAPKKSLVIKFAEKYSVEPTKVLEILKATAFRQKAGVVISNEQMGALLIVADQYDLNPFTREIYAFPDEKRGGIVPVVGVDGWSRISNQHPAFDGVEFVYSDESVAVEGTKVNCPIWIEAVIYRKDRSQPTRVREYLDECIRNTGPWQSHPKRMLRHKAFVQGVRLSMSFVGIYDVDEAERIVDITPDGVVTHASTQSRVPAQVVMAQAVTALAPPSQLSVDKSIKQLVDKAARDGDWQYAYRWTEQRFKGETRAYAVAALEKARAAKEAVELQDDSVFAELDEVVENQLESGAAELA